MKCNNTFLRSAEAAAKLDRYTLEINLHSEMKSESIITPIEAVGLLLAMGIAMFIVCKETRGSERHADGFLVADRKVGVWRGALSIAVSWIWAPAIFICSMQSFTKGLAGIFWFTFPNILCFFIFMPIAVRLRKLMPNGYSFPDYIAEKRFPGQTKTHFAYLTCPSLNQI